MKITKHLPLVVLGFISVIGINGAALLAGGHAAEAEKVFRDDLAYNPKNGRSLFGLWKAIEAQGRRADAQRAAAAFRPVWAAADTQLTLSGF